MSSNILKTALFLCFTVTPALADSSVYQGTPAPWLDEQSIKIEPIHLKNDGLKADITEQQTKRVGIEPEASAIETYYNGRLSEQELTQFGYEIFNKPAPSYDAPLGAVQDNYVLNIGDSLKIAFTGQRNDQDEYTISPQGTLFIPDFSPISAAGRTIAEVREEISQISESQLNLQAYVSLASIGQIGILIVGEVENPGRYNLTGFHSALDALIMAGGVKKDGSLRKIKIVRNGRSSSLDLYSLFLDGLSIEDFNLRDGDRIIVPPIGPTLAISGDVKRPAIYEIRETSGGMRGKRGSETLSVNKALSLSGGLISSGKNNRYMMLREDARTGQDFSQMLTDLNRGTLTDSSILIVNRSLSSRAGAIEIKGHSNMAGLHDLSYNLKLSDILGSKENLKPDTYPLIGIIERKDKKYFSTQFISFPLRIVLDKKIDFALQSSDIVHIFSNADIKKVLNAKINDTTNIENVKLSYNIDLINFLKNQAINLRGAVKNPGKYPISNGVTLAGLLAASGGLRTEADPHNIEVSSIQSGIERRSIDLDTTDPDNVTLRVGDTIRVNKHHHKMARQNVTLYGEVRSPGEYDLLPGDKMSDLLERAGGLTEQAYPAGTVFSRESERKAEEMRYKALAQEIRRSLAASLQSEKNKPNDTQIATVQNLAAELEHAAGLGRITVETNPAILRHQPELDILLEAGDKIYIPKRPLTVRVSGEVLSPAVLQFRKEKDPMDYIREAGSFTYHADKGRSFVMFPDGSAKPLKVNIWSHDPIFIPPGSTIIVPRDPKPFDFIESARDVTQILSNLAITSVLIDDLRD